MRLVGVAQAGGYRADGAPAPQCQQGLVQAVTLDHPLGEMPTLSRNHRCSSREVHPRAGPERLNRGHRAVRRRGLDELAQERAMYRALGSSFEKNAVATATRSASVEHRSNASR